MCAHVRIFLDWSRNNNPAYKTQNNSENYVITVISEENSVIKLDLDIKLDTFWMSTKPTMKIVVK
nr:hypothetical protein [Gardnerella vaginalis]